MIMSKNMMYVCLLFTVGQTFGFLHLNAQLVWEWWRDKPFVAVVLFSIPAGLCFWLGIKLAYEELGVVWGPRFLMFSLSYLTFPILTWYFLNESMFTAKTMTCVFLSFVIMAIQLFWK